MKDVLFLVLCGVLAVLEVKAYPAYYYPYYGSMDSMSAGSMDSRQGGMVLSRYYQPYYNTGLLGGAAAFMLNQPQQLQPNQPYYLPQRRPEPQQTELTPPAAQNEVIPQEKFTTKQPETIGTDPTENSDISTTVKSTTELELIEPEVEEVEIPQEPKRRVSKKKQEKRPVDVEDDDYSPPKMPSGTFFPMFFGWGRQSGGAPGVTAIANAFSTSRGGVASSHATAYGVPKEDQPYGYDTPRKQDIKRQV